jgi:hypothetical protein
MIRLPRFLNELCHFVSFPATWSRESSSRHLANALVSHALQRRRALLAPLHARILNLSAVPIRRDKKTMKKTIRLMYLVAEVLLILAVDALGQCVAHSQRCHAAQLAQIGPQRFGVWRSRHFIPEQPFLSFIIVTISGHYNEKELYLAKASSLSLRISSGGATWR